MARDIKKRVNFYDGQRVGEDELDAEQSAWHGTISSIADTLLGSGIEKDAPVQRIIFDSYDVPSSVQTLIDTQNFDGEPIYEQDSFDNDVFVQPSDTSQGNQLEVEITDAALDGSHKIKVYLFGLTFGGTFVEEVLTFDDNISKITRNYFTKIVSFMTQNFRGNQNTIVDGVKSRNVGGRLRILESLPMSVALDTIMAEQVKEPNQDYVNFKPATQSKTLDTILNEIAESDDLDADDLNVNVTATTTRLLPDDTTGLIIGQKFKATTNNIQKVTLLLAVEEDTTAAAGHEFDWSGDLVIGIVPLQTTTSCPSDIVPDTQIEFEPAQTPLAEVSIDGSGLADAGISLTDTAQEVDFVFTQSLLSDPNNEPTIVPGNYYVLTIRRSGNISTGTIILQEATNTDDERRLTIFSSNKWTDIENRSLWFQVHTDAIRITDGVAYDSGVQIISPKVVKNDSTGLDEAYIEGFHSFIDTSRGVENYIIAQKSNKFGIPETHPSTGNSIFTRIHDAPTISVVNESTLTTLLDAGNDTVILGSIRDDNPVNNPEISGTINFPGLVRSNTFTILKPSSDITNNNLVGSVLVPNISEPNVKYRIIKSQVFTDAYGDINNDGVIDLNDVVRAQDLDGYSKSLEGGTVPSSDQRNAIINGTVSIEEIIRADVNADDVITSTDAQIIQQKIALGTAFAVGSSFKRAVLTIENLTDPLTTTANMLTDSAFNAIPFSPVSYRIEPVNLWSESNVVITDLRRFVMKTFSEVSSANITGDTKTGGANNTFVPGDLLLTGSILDTEGDPYSIDFETTSITIDLPEGATAGELDVFSEFVKNKMKFSDGTTVGSTALSDGQVKITAAVNSIAKDRGDGYEDVQELVGILYTPSTSLLRIRAENIKHNSTKAELRTKIVITIYLKKAGFKNSDQSVGESDLSDLLVDL